MGVFLSTLITERPELNILYQDDYLVAIDKPANLFVHRSFMDKEEKYFALQLVRDMVGQYVYPLHRLDKPTSGVLLFALCEDVARALSEDFHENRVKKQYFALTRGYVSPAKGVIEHPITIKLDKIADKFKQQDTEAKDATTAYECLATASLPFAVGKYDSVRYSLVSAQPHTGRRHQIRKHLAHLRYPIIGDINYGDNKQNPFFARHFGFKRLMLFAQAMQFTHPVTKAHINVAAQFDQQWLSVFNQLGWSTSIWGH